MADEGVRDYDGEEYEVVEDAASFAAVPDAFQRLWTPYRIAYIREGSEPDYQPGACPFCVAPTLSDEEALIVARGTHAYVLLNLYPYNSGHLLVCPYRHVALYDEATDEEVAEIGSLTQTAMRVLTATSGAHGYNIGMNQGRLAGAGVADHLHQHVVPRWALDSNFLPIIAGHEGDPAAPRRGPRRGRGGLALVAEDQTTGIRLAGDRAFAATVGLSTMSKDSKEQAGQDLRGSARVKRGLAEMLKGGVIMDVVTADQAKIAEDAGAVAVMALERVPADIRAQGGVARMSDPDLIDGIIAAVSIPVMAKARIGHFVEAQVLQALKVDYIDESEVLSPADYVNHIDKWQFDVPFVCGATNLGEALRRITEGAAMIRSKGEAGTGDVSEATKHIRTITGEINQLRSMTKDELYVAAKELQAPYELVREVAEAGKLPVVLFTAGGVATPADAALMMQLGADGVFVGSGIFKAGEPAKRAAAIVKAVTFYDDAEVIAEASRGLGEAMVGINVADMPAPHRLADRGW